jgi:hypothetical protein
MKTGNHQFDPQDATPARGDASAAAPASSVDQAFECAFDYVAAMYRHTGGIRRQVIGFEFRPGLPMDTHVEHVTASSQALMLIATMRRRWDVVVHVQMADVSKARPLALNAQARQRIVAFDIHGARQTAFSHCVLDPARREMTRGVLITLSPPRQQGPFQR